jgi:formylglycine-generating enzyme required for sulfatase activity
MLGNVQEWTCSEYQYKYKEKAEKCINKNSIDSTRLSLRGGSWDTKTNKLTYRNKWSATTRYATIGFRVVRLMR